MKAYFFKLMVALVLLALILTISWQPTQAAVGDQLDTTFNYGAGGTNNVFAVEFTQAGEILIGGNFTSYNGDTNAPDRVMRLTSSGAPDTGFNFGATNGASSFVLALATRQANGTYLSGGKILVGGDFTSYNGAAAAPDRILRLNADGSLDSTFNASGSGANATVNTIAVQNDGKILVGGDFTSYNGNAAAPNYIMRLNADGSLDTTFNNGGVGPNNSVWTITVQPDGKILIGGFFVSYNGNVDAPNGIMRLNADGTLDTTFNVGAGARGLLGNSGFQGYANSIVVQPDNKILVGGYFTNFGGSSGVWDANAPDHLLRLNADGQLDTTFNYGAGLGANDAVYDLALQSDGKVLITGVPVSYNGNAGAPDRFMRINADGTLDSGYNSGGAGIDAAANAILLNAAEEAFLGGVFTSYNGDANASNGILKLRSASVTVTINQAASQADPTSASPINFTVVFSSPVTGFGDAPGDVSLGGTASGTLTATVSESGPMDGTTYTVSVSGMTSSGTVIASIPANVVTGGNLASTSTDNVVTYNVTVVPTPTATATPLPTATPPGGEPGAEGLQAGLPATGFQPGQTTSLPAQPADKAYTSYNDMLLEIPSLQVSMPIVGVPLSTDGWDVTWLENNAGWLNGTAFPTWAGNTVITAHVWDAHNRPGPFAGLKTLRYGDVIKIQAWGQTYQYEVRESRLISPKNTTAVIKHEELDWVTLVTCEDYNLLFAKYSYRRVVRAVLTKVSGQ